MRKITLFAEDFGHESVVHALINRFERRYAVRCQIRNRSVRGGHGKALTELASFVRELRGLTGEIPDLLIVAIDANCQGYQQVRKEVESRLLKLSLEVAIAVPDPHVERWLLVDSAAFKAALGRGCDAPDLKCDRKRYKQLLTSAIRAAGTTPLIGGMEHAERIIEALDEDRVKHKDASFGRFLGELESVFSRWSTACSIERPE